MNWDRVNSWTSTFYTLIRSLDLAKRYHFSTLEPLEAVVLETKSWTPDEASYGSVLLAHPFGRGPMNIRRDPDKYFQQIVAQLVQMLAQDLVVIFDEMMDDILAARGDTAGTFPQSKVQKLAKYLDVKYEWSRQGCLELIAVRNVLAHAGGRWNARSIAIVSTFVNPVPAEGEALRIGIPMLFRYRKAMRTFLNQVKP